LLRVGTKKIIKEKRQAELIKLKGKANEIPRATNERPHKNPAKAHKTG